MDQELRGGGALGSGVGVPVLQVVDDGPGAVHVVRLLVGPGDGLEVAERDVAEGGEEARVRAGRPRGLDHAVRDRVARAQVGSRVGRVRRFERLLDGLSRALVRDCPLQQPPFCQSPFMILCVDRCTSILTLDHSSWS